MSKESPPVREVIPFKPGKRQSTFRKLNLDFAGTALEEALALQRQQSEAENQAGASDQTSLTPVTGVRDDKDEDRGIKDTGKMPLTGQSLSAQSFPIISETPFTPVTGVIKIKKENELTPVTGVNSDVAPKRDFTRAANSIVRDAIPSGVFTGKGKHLYDYLYSQTRGAIAPVISARIPTEKVMAGAAMTRNTFRFHLERLCNAGLIRVEQRAGEHGGNIYKVFLPEEIGLQRGERGERGERGDTGENLPLVQGSEVDPSNPGLSSGFSTGYGAPKTLIKTDEKKTDDEAFARFLIKMKGAAKELTGRDPSSAEVERWEELADVLVTELKIAAGRTTVSSIPAFLAEHLRRRLWKKEKRQIEAEASEHKTAVPARKIDASKCPDCFGAGMYYPGGYEKGVARCLHTKLTTDSAE